MNFTTEFVTWGVRTHLNSELQTPSSDLQWLFIDWLACLCTGLKSFSTQALARALNPSETNSFCLTSFSKIDKAMVLGFASHCKEMDDSEFSGETHPSAILFSTLMAIADEDTPFENILRCAWLGYQSLRPLGRVLNPDHYAAGWHGTGTVGVYACTLSAALLKNMDTQKIENALGIAGTLSSGIQASFGTQSKYLNSGRASANAVLSIFLTENDMNGAQRIFEGKNGIFQMFNSKKGDHRFDFEVDTDSSLQWIKIKKYPGCHCLEPIINCALSSSKDIHDLKKIKKIQLFLSKYDSHIVGQRAPQTIEQAYFSATWMVAIALLKKNVDFLTDLNEQSSTLEEIEKSVELIVDEKLMPMECRLIIRYSDRLLETQSQLNRQLGQNDFSFLDKKFDDLVNPYAIEKDFLKKLKTLFKSTSITCGQVKQFVAKSIGLSI